MAHPTVSTSQVTTCPDIVQYVLDGPHIVEDLTRAAVQLLIVTELWSSTTRQLQGLRRTRLHKVA